MITAGFAGGTEWVVTIKGEYAGLVLMELFSILTVVVSTQKPSNLNNRRKRLGKKKKKKNRASETSETMTKSFIFM